MTIPSLPYFGSQDNHIHLRHLEGIERFIDEERPYNLALSINDTDPEKRRRNMPIEKTYPFAEIASMLERKFPVSRNRLTIEYVMRKDNISMEDAKKLKKIFRNSRIKLNLIPLNLEGGDSHAGGNGRLHQGSGDNECSGCR
jgi:23S rRNA (adenine2503-C2)-methyltransferase